MIAVADTSVISYLLLIGEIEILSRIFQRVLLPRAVLSELLDQDAPEMVRTWASALPSWASVEDAPFSPMPGMEHLQAGERAPILLAERGGA